MTDQQLGNVEVIARAHIVVDGTAMNVNETRVVNLDSGENRQLVRYGLLEIIDEETKKLLPPTEAFNAKVGGCGCGS